MFKFIINILIDNFAKVKKYLLFFLIFSNYNVFGNSYGLVCEHPSASLVSESFLNKILSDSLVGYLQSIIDIRNCYERSGNSENESSVIFDGCAERSDRVLRICISPRENPQNITESDNIVPVDLVHNEIVKLSSITSNPVIINNNFFKNLDIVARYKDNLMCLYVDTFFGFRPILCRRANETTATATAEGGAPSGQNLCNSTPTSCRYNGENNSKYYQTSSRRIIGVTGKIMQCVYETLDKIFFNPDTCPPNSNIEESIRQQNNILIKPFATLQKSLRQTVLILMIFYIVFQGVKWIFEPDSLSIQEGFLVAFKMIIIIYFSVGISVVNRFLSIKEHDSGMTSIVLPTIINTSTILTNFVATAVSDGFGYSSNLCRFDFSQYPADKSYYAIFDRLDCTLGIFLGVNRALGHKIQSSSEFTKITHNINGSNVKPRNFSGIDVSVNGESLVRFSSRVDMRPEALIYDKGIPVVILIFALVKGFQIIQAYCLISLTTLMISLISRMVLSIILTVIMVYLLAYLSPIFIPLALFEKTKGKFEKWLNLLIGTSLQPIILVSFGGIIISLFISIIFDGCNFDIYQNHHNQRYFDLILSNIAEEATKCKNSVGYLMHATLFAEEGTWIQISAIFFDAYRFVVVPGLMDPAILVAIFIYILGGFAEKVSSFASSLTDGLDVGGMITSPVDIGRKLKASAGRSMQKAGMTPKAMMQNKAAKAKQNKKSSKAAYANSFGK